MGFFDKAKDAIVSAGKDVAEMTSDATATAKTKMAAKELENSIEKKLNELGHEMMEMHQAEAAQLCPDIVAEINALQEELAGKRNELDAAKAEKEAAKAAKAEAKVEEAAQEAASKVTCPQCGALVDPSAKFCNVCGHNMAE